MRCLKMKLWKHQMIDSLRVSHEERRSLVSNVSAESGVLKQAKMEVGYYCCRDYFPCVPARYVLSVMGCIGLVIVYALRVNMSVALVAMVNESASSEGPHQRRSSNGSATPVFSCQPTAPVFNWGPTDQGGWTQTPNIELRSPSPFFLHLCSLLPLPLSPSSTIQDGCCLLSSMATSSLKYQVASLPLGSVASTSLVWGSSSHRPSPC